MPTYQTVLDLEREFHNSENTVILNDLPAETESDLARINNILITTYTSATISAIPGCLCRYKVGAYKLGVVCPKCNTKVSYDIMDVRARVWLRAPESVPGFINPQIWAMTRTMLRKSNFDVLRWITDTSYRSGIKEPAIVTKLKSDPNIVRGYSHFVNNFISTVEYILSYKQYYQSGRAAKEKVAEFIKFLEDNQDKIITGHMPIINRNLLVMEKTSRGIYTNKILEDLLDGIYTIIGATDVSQKRMENRVAKTIAILSMFYQNLNKRMFTSKHSLFRKHVFGTRTNFSFRTVISNITGPHIYNQIHIPWMVGLVIFRPHLINILVRRYNYKLTDAVQLLLDSTYKYNKTLDEIFQYLIEAAGPLGICCTINRNPTISPSSILRVYISKVKTNVNDRTTGMPIVIATHMNADLDGDELNFQLALDKQMEDMWYNLSPHKTMMDYNVPNALGSYLFHTKSVRALASEFINSEQIATEKDIENMVNAFGQ